jgi:uncharacterized protein
MPDQLQDSVTPPPPPVPPQPNTLQTVFLGPQGLRAGWRLLIFIAILAVLAIATHPLGRIIAHKYNMGTEFSAPNVVIGESLSFLLLLIASAIMGRFEHRSLAAYGLPFRLILRKQFWTGALWGFAMLSVIVVLMDASHAYSFGALALSPVDIVKDGLFWALGFLMVGFTEEFLFRGYVQFTLTTGLGFWPAATITCLLFAGGHIRNPGENIVGVLEIVLIAFFLCLALRRTGNLWFAVGWHMAFDWGESFFYSTPNSGIHATGHLLKSSLMGSKWLSGGTVGPEASVFDVMVTVAGILLLAKLYPTAKYPAVREPASANAILSSPPPQIADPGTA